MKKTPPPSSTLQSLFANLFRRDRLLALARQVKALKRLRDIHPADLCLSLLAAAFGDEERSIASARRAFGRITGRSVEESSYYERFTPELADLLRQLVKEALSSQDEAKSHPLMEMIDELGLRDVLAIDASQVTLCREAAGQFPSTNPDHGGIKLTTTLSVLFGRIQSVAVTDAKTHDRRALKLARWLHGMLLIFDRGYSDHQLFLEIVKRGGFFITRLKESSLPVVENIRSGLGQTHVDKPLDGGLPYRGTVDIDARFRIRGKQTRSFRVIRLEVEKVVANQGKGTVDVWLVTNLPPDVVTPDQIGLMYRLRWSIEKLFHVLKAVGRLDQLQSASSDVIHAFLYATLLGAVLSQDVCALMRKARPRCQPSLHRVTMLVVGWLADLARAYAADQFAARLHEFEQALWREGTNPNPGRPYMVQDYVDMLAYAA